MWNLEITNRDTTHATSSCSPARTISEISEELIFITSNRNRNSEVKQTKAFRSCTSPCSSIMYNTKWHCEPEKNLRSPSALSLLYPQAPCWVTPLLNLRRQSLRLCPRGGSIYLFNLVFSFSSPLHLNFLFTAQSWNSGSILWYHSS